MFKFSLRELMALVLIVALAIGWWLDRARLVVAHRQSLGNEQLLRNRLAMFEKDALQSDAMIVQLERRIDELEHTHGNP